MPPKFKNYTDYLRFAGMDFDGDHIFSVPHTIKPQIKNVIFHDPATIVYWTDGTKTVVKCQEGDTFDPEKGLAMAICKGMLGTNESGANFNDIFKKWIPKDDFEKKMNPPEQRKQITVNMTVAEFAKMAGVSDNTIRKQCAAGQLKGAHKINGKWYIPVTKRV